ncbi:hypothetical protein B0H10DRAFT_2186880 [Mycena sp. CBHHK59/15]|nr:hypothetical protein B0H10DRAFT_2186880 [Mycena sp. CBHHK59/15]
MEYNFAFEYPPTYQDSYGFNWPEIAQRRLEARELIERFELASPRLNRTLKAAEQETFWLPYNRREISLSDGGFGSSLPFITGSAGRRVACSELKLSKNTSSDGGGDTCAQTNASRERGDVGPERTGALGKRENRGRLCKGGPVHEVGAKADPLGKVGAFGGLDSRCGGGAGRRKATFILMAGVEKGNGGPVWAKSARGR